MVAFPSVASITETRHDGGFLVSEARGMRSRDQGTIANSGGVILAGTVMGKQTVSAVAPTPVALGTNVGTSTFGTVTVAAPAVTGNYTVEMLSATTFAVFDPHGIEIGHGTLGVAFAAGGIGFTLTTGGSPTAGDSYTIPVAAGTGKWVTFDPTAADGSEIAAGILFGHTDVTAADFYGTLMTRSCEVNASELIWGANVTTTPQKTAALATLAGLGIVAR